MSVAFGQRDHRQRLIRELLRGERVQNQDELRRLLRHRGVRAEQATLPRDLHALGVVKGPDGYRLPESPVATSPARAELIQLVRHYLAAADATGPLVVLRTGPGRAQPLGLALDNARILDVLGTIAGDDTIFVAVRSPLVAEWLVELLRSIAEGATPDEGVFDLAPRTTHANGRR